MRSKLPNLRALAVLAVACVAGAGACLAGTAYAGSRADVRAGTATHAKSKHTVIYIRAVKIHKLGTVLVNSSGHALYVYAPDKAKKVTCSSSCQSYWPPATVPANATVKAEGAVKQSLLGTDSNPATHKRIVTYGGWPLYTYLGDSSAGEANGQNMDESGGYWWVIRPNGKPLK